MALSGVDDYEVAAQLIKAKVHLLVLHLTAAKVQVDCAADGAGHLVHEAGGLVPVPVLRILADPRIVGVVDAAPVEELIEDRTDEHLKGCGGGDASGADDLRGDAGVKAPDPVPEFIPRSLQHAAHEREAPLALRDLLEVIRVDDDRIRIALAEDRDHAVPGLCRDGDRVHRDAGSKDLAAVVIRVISDDLGSARCGEAGQLLLAKLCLIGALQLLKARLRFLCRIPVDSS